MKRREFLTISSVAAISLLVDGCGSGGSSKSSSAIGSDVIASVNGNQSVDSNGNKNTLKFTSSLVIPPILEGTDIGGVLHFDLNIQKGNRSFFDGTTTDTYGINGDYLGPTLRVANGDNVSINYTNNLNEITTIHAHGMHLPAMMDGGPHQIIDIGQKWSAVYKVNQKACTNWYHPHLMGKTAEHVYKGIAGLIIVEDSESKALDLPKTYGKDDIPLVLQDRFFDSNYQFDYTPSRMEIMHGYHGDIFLTNGTINPYLDVEAKEIRFRVLNGSNSTVYNLGFDDGRVFRQIATDNAFLESPVSLSSLRLSPGERAEIVVDFSNDLNKKVSLKDLTQNKNFLKINIITTATKATKTPKTLTVLERYSLSEAINIRKFVLSGRMGNLYINGKSMDKNFINESVPVDQLEVWEVTNQMGMDHNFHIHATHFQIVERNGSSANVSENERGYKDTIYLAPNDSVKLMVKMRDYTDANSPYMYHCHFLEHEDAGMMGQFVVV